MKGLGHRLLMTTYLVLAATIPCVQSAVANGQGAAKPHEHGVGKLDVAVDGLTVAIEGELPGVDVFGFEHRPRNPKETQVIVSALTTLRQQPSPLFELPNGAGCTLAKVEVKAEGLEDAVDQAGAKAKPATPEPGHEHADVDISYRFNCQKSPVGGTLTVKLFGAFPHLTTLRVQVLSGTSQAGVTLRAADGRVGTVKL